MASNPRTIRNSSYIIWGLAAAVVILGVVAVRGLTQQRTTIAMARVEYLDLTKTSSTNGKLEPIEDFKLTAQAAGQVEQIYVKLGQMVRPGEMLLRMDDKAAVSSLAHANSELKSTQQAADAVRQGGTQEERTNFAADLSRAQLQRQQDAAALASLKALQQHGAASAGEVAAAQHRVELDDNSIQAIQARSAKRYDASDQAKIQAQIADSRAAITAAQGEVARVDVRSPISGTVYYLPVSRFDMVAAGDDLVSVADLKKLRVTAYFDEPDVGALANGQPVTITWDARPGKVWHGHVSQVPTTIISYGTRNVGECFVTVDDPDGTMPNANVNITVITAEHQHVLAVPRDSLHFDGSRAYVYRIVNDTLAQTQVSTAGGILNNDWAEITGGLKEGDAVARNAVNNRELKDGLKVEIAK